MGPATIIKRLAPAFCVRDLILLLAIRGTNAKPDYQTCPPLPHCPIPQPCRREMPQVTPEELSKETLQTPTPLAPMNPEAIGKTEIEKEATMRC